MSRTAAIHSAAEVTSALPAKNSDLARVSPEDLAELMSVFNDTAARLQETHAVLGAEVSRLQNELSETKGRLRRAQELAALGEMAAGIAHEIRNPLGSIKLYASMLEQDLLDRPEEKATASKIARAVDRLNAVVGDVLTFSRELRPKLTHCSAHRLFEEAADSCASVARTLGITIDDAYLESPDRMIHADNALFHQALVNIIRNALEAAADGSHRDRPIVRLSLKDRSLLTDDRRRSRMLAFRIVDSGPGIAPEVRDRIFNPFFTTRDAGTGLGLAIVHRILDAHDGRITIADREDPALDQQDRTLGGAAVDLLIPHDMYNPGLDAPGTNGELR